MDELVNMVAQKVNIPPDKAREAVNTVVGFLRDKLPAPIAGHLDGLLHGGGAATAARLKARPVVHQAQAICWAALSRASRGCSAGRKSNLPAHPDITDAAGDFLLVEVLQEGDCVLACRAEEVAHGRHVHVPVLIYSLKKEVAHLVIRLPRVEEVIRNLHKFARVHQGRDHSRAASLTRLEREASSGWWSGRAASAPPAPSARGKRSARAPAGGR